MSEIKYWRLADALSAVSANTEAIVRHEGATSSHYRIYADARSLYNAVIAADTNETLHEITRTSTDKFAPLQKLYFDIDLSREKWGEFSGRHIETQALELLDSGMSSWAASVGIKNERLERLVATSSDYVTKVSLHVVYSDLRFREHAAMRRVAQLVRSALPVWLGSAVDVLYKRNQGLRLLWSRKLGSSVERRKRPLSGNWASDSVHALAMGMIHAYGEDGDSVDVYAPRPAEFAPAASADPGNLYRALKALEDAENAAASSAGGGNPPAGGSYRERCTKWTDRGCFISLLRTAPSCCAICKRTHESENPAIVCTNGVYRVICPRAGKGHSIVIMRDQQTIEFNAAERVAKAERVAAIAATEQRFAAAEPEGLPRESNAWEPEPESFEFCDFAEDDAWQPDPEVTRCEVKYAQPLFY